MSSRRHEYRLFVAGDSARSHAAAANLRRALDEALGPDQYRLEVVDVLARPDVAEDEGILATPTTVQVQPPPPRRVIGDLTDEELLSRMLDLDLHRRNEGEPT